MQTKGVAFIDTVIKDIHTKYLAVTDMELYCLLTGLTEVLVNRTNTLDRDWTEGRFQDMQTCIFLIGKCHQLRSTEMETL